VSARGTTSVLLLALLAACGGNPRPRDVDSLLLQLESDDPAERAWAVSELGRREEPTAVPGLVARLRDSDGGIRMMSAATLREMTGQAFGFRAYAAAEEREAAVRRWETWLAAREEMP
jgi:HEAT repeat protein